MPTYGTRIFSAGRRSAPHPFTKTTLQTGLPRKPLRGWHSRLVEFKAAAIQVTEDVAVACYWITFKWLDKDGNGAANTIRITHTWRKTGNDWRIRGGMSMPEPDTSPK